MRKAEVFLLIQPIIWSLSKLKDGMISKISDLYQTNKLEV